MADSTTLKKMADLIFQRAALTCDISRLWGRLTNDEENAMNNIIAELKNDDYAPISMSLDALVLCEHKWGEKVQRLIERFILDRLAQM